MIKHQHNEFPSDLFLTLETIGGQVVVTKGPGPDATEIVAVSGFLSLNMDKKIILKIIIPGRDSEVFLFKSYKLSNYSVALHNSIMDKKINVGRYLNTNYYTFFIYLCRSHHVLKIQEHT